MRSPFADLRFGWRLLLKRPAFTAVMILTLALGIGVTTAISSVVNAILIDPWPYDDPEELIALRGSFATNPTTWVAYLEFQASSSPCPRTRRASPGRCYGPRWNLRR